MNMIKYFAKFLTCVSLVLVCATGAANAAEATATQDNKDRIYRTVDSAGRVSFSDKPPAPGTKNASAIELRGVNNSYANPIPRQPYEPGLNDDADSATLQYSSLVITYPENNAQLRDNAGNVRISTRVAPGLRRGDRVMLVLDGQRVPEEAEGTEIALTNVSRGTHSISLEVVDQAGNVQLKSDEQVFHLQRFAPNLAP